MWNLSLKHDDKGEPERTGALKFREPGHIPPDSTPAALHCATAPVAPIAPGCARLRRPRHFFSAQPIGKFRVLTPIEGYWFDRWK
jgi:hypothetical protein